jgi:hypothetical protein
MQFSAGKRISKEQVIEHHIHIAMRALVHFSDFLEAFLHVQIAEEMLDREMQRSDLLIGNPEWDEFLQSEEWRTIQRHAKQFYNWAKHNNRGDEPTYLVSFDPHNWCWAGLALTLIRYQVAFKTEVRGTNEFLQALAIQVPEGVKSDEVDRYLKERGIQLL